MEKMCQKFGKKLNALSRIPVLLNKDKKGYLFYCPLIWMFSSRKCNCLISKIHERSLRFITNDENSKF